MAGTECAECERPPRIAEHPEGGMTKYDTYLGRGPVGQAVFVRWDPRWGGAEKPWVAMDDLGASPRYMRASCSTQQEAAASVADMLAAHLATHRKVA